MRAASRQYLSTAAPMYAFIGLSISMYFSSQGAAKVLGPVLAQTARLVFIAAGGWWLSTYDATAANYFALAAASMVRARRAVRRQRHLDAMGTEGRPAAGYSPGAVLNDRDELMPPPVTPVAAADIGHPHQLRNHAHHVAAAAAAEHAHDVAAAAMPMP